VSKIDDAMTEAELLARSDANHFQAFRLLVAAADGGEIREKEGLLIAATGIPAAGLNRAYVTCPLTNPESLVGEAISYFDARGLPFSFRMRQGLDPASERAAKAHGLQHSGTLPVMVLSPLQANEEGPASIEIEEVRDPEMLSHHLEVVAAAFGWPLDLGQRFIPRRLLDAQGAQFFIGYVDGQPVAAAQLIMTPRTAGIYHAATLEPFRRRDFGTTMTLHVLRMGAAARCQVAILQASEMGRSLYERMGFRTVAAYRTYMRPAASGQQEVQVAR
jgi:ribosomal protein S18 acetylase RimI-like enzyme